MSYFAEKRHYDVTLKKFRFINSHLTASNKGESANQNAAYKIIALKLLIMLLKAALAFIRKILCLKAEKRL